MIEILFDANNDKKTYHHFAVNPGSMLCDAIRSDSKWNSTAIAATSKEEGAKAGEMAIFLKEIHAHPDVNRERGFQMARI